MGSTGTGVVLPLNKKGCLAMLHFGLLTLTIYCNLTLKVLSEYQFLEREPKTYSR